MPAQHEAASRMLRVNGIELRVRIDGPAGAPWLVLSNSLGVTLEMWEPQVAAFAQAFRVVRYDTRGHGRSAVPPGPYAIEHLGGDVLGLLDGLGIECAHFCGLSMGGATGMWLATHAPGRIGRLALCNTTPWLGPPDAINARIAAIRRDGVAPLVPAILERWFTVAARTVDSADVESIRQMLFATPAAGYVACCEALRDMDQRAALARISAPTLVTAGTFDPAPTPAAARAWAVTIPGARFVELPGAHLANVEAAAAFNAAVGAFLAG